MESMPLVGLVLWGTVVSVDLVSTPQIMVTRPIVAATVAGWITGDLVTGALIGVLLELFASEVMPFGAAQYPDYGVGAVAATATAAGAPGVLAIGPAICVGLLTAYFGGVSIQWVRRWNTTVLERYQHEIDAGDFGTILRAHWGSLGRDVVRGAGLVSIGLALAWAVRNLPTVSDTAAIGAFAVAVGAALGTGFTSGLRLAGQTPASVRWFGAGLATGGVWMALL